MHITTTKSKNAESFYTTQTFKRKNTGRDGVQWAREQEKLETEKYKKENEEKTILIPFHLDRELDCSRQKFYTGGHLFFYPEYDLNTVLSDLIFTRILEPDSKRSSFKSAQSFLEASSYGLHDVYHTLNVLAEECGFIQSEL